MAFVINVWFGVLKTSTTILGGDNTFIIYNIVLHLNDVPMVQGLVLQQHLIIIINSKSVQISTTECCIL